MSPIDYRALVALAHAESEALTARLAAYHHALQCGVSPAVLRDEAALLDHYAEQLARMTASIDDAACGGVPEVPVGRWTVTAGGPSERRQAGQLRAMVAHSSTGWAWGASVSHELAGSGTGYATETEALAAADEWLMEIGGLWVLDPVLLSDLGEALEVEWAQDPGPIDAPNRAEVSTVRPLHEALEDETSGLVCWRRSAPAPHYVERGGWTIAHCGDPQCREAWLARLAEIADRRAS